MKARIAVATVDHRHGIAALAAAALKVRVDAESPRVQRILDSGYTFVAIAEGKVVGFVSNFITRDGLGRRRFELDLLGVAPAWRRRGIGAQLVERSLQVARQSSATNARALVRRDNMPMQRICRRHGFQRSQSAHQLLVSQVRQPARNGSRNTTARIIAVDTLTYSGYWLEGEILQGAIDGAQQLLQDHAGPTQFGAVVPDYDRTTIDLLRANSFDRIGDFDWWTLTL